MNWKVYQHMGVPNNPVFHDYSFDRFKELVVLLILFYCLQSIGLVSSANTRGAFFDMQLKLSLLLVPLLYPYGRKMYESSRSTFLWTFVVGCGAASFYYFGYATYRSLSLINGVLVFNPRIPVYGGPSYFLSHAIVISFAMVVVGVPYRYIEMVRVFFDRFYRFEIKGLCI